MADGGETRKGKIGVIVLDFGTSWLKGGIAGESLPMCVVPVHRYCHILWDLNSDGEEYYEALVENTDNSCKVEIEEVSRSVEGNDCTPLEIYRKAKAKICKKIISYDDYFEMLKDLLNWLFNYQLKIQPTNKKVLLLEQIHTPTPFRQALSDLLFGTYEVKSISFLNNQITAIYTCGISTGISVDCAHMHCRVLPVLTGMPHLNAYVQTSPPISGRGVLASLQTRILNHNRQARHILTPRLSYKVLIDILGRFGYVRTVPRKDLPCGVEIYSLHGFKFEIPQSSLWKCYEPLFTTATGRKPIQWVVREAVELTPIDCRPQLIQNILLSGGLAEVRGFRRRVAYEIREEFQNRPLLNKMMGKVIFGNPVCTPVCRQWTGGSMLAPIHKLKEYTWAEFAQGVPLPDWLADPFVPVSAKHSVG